MSHHVPQGKFLETSQVFCF